jgi:ferritin-like metal-binding protein YciE
MPNNQTLRELMIDEIRDLYDAERQLVKALPKMAKGATSDELRGLIEGHLAETEEHVKRIEQAFELLDENVRGKHCAGIAGIIEEGGDLLEEDFDGAVLDAGIIAGAQRAEHYEIGAYGSVIAWAKLLGEDEVATLLSDTLEEEKAADQKLSDLAESSVNSEAAAMADEEGDDDDEDTDDEDEEVKAEESESNEPVGTGRARAEKSGSSRKRRA